MDLNLYKAAAKGEIEPFKEIGKGELGSILTHHNITVLHVNIGESVSTEFVKWMLEECPSLLLQVNDKGDTPLHVAAKFGHVAVVEVLIEFAKKQTRELESSVMEQLLEKKSSLTKVKDQHGWTPLHHAAYSGREFISKLLLECDKSAANIGDKDRKMTPLHLAAGRGHIRSVKEIIFSGPDDCCEQVDDRGWNLLHFGMLSLNGIQLTYLLRKKSVVTLINNKDVNGNTPLHVLAALCRFLTNEVISCKLRVHYEAVNNNDISVNHVIHHGFPELEQEIQELSKDIGRGQYSDGVIKVRKEKLAIENEDDFKEIRQQHTLVATLIATVTFAAAFTLPGAYWNKRGRIPGAAFLKMNAAFQAFVITDAIAMVLSLSTVFIHFLISINTLRKVKFFLYLAHNFAMLSMLAMAVAFVTGTYAILAPSSWLPIVSCFLGLSFVIFVIFTICKFFTELMEINAGEL